MNATGFDFVGVLLRTARHVVTRAVRQSDGLRVLLKEDAAPSGRQHGGLQREFELIQRLPLKGVPRALEVAIPLISPSDLASSL